MCTFGTTVSDVADGCDVVELDRISLTGCVDFLAVLFLATAFGREEEASFSSLPRLLPAVLCLGKLKGARFI